MKATGWRTTYAAWVPEEVLAPLLDEAAQTAALTAELGDAANFAVVARDHGRIVGFASCLWRADPLLDSFHVLPEARGDGIGAAILRLFVDELARRRATTLVVEVVEQNSRTRALYERLGATYTTTEPAAWAPEHVREAHYRWDDLEALRQRL